MSTLDQADWQRIEEVLGELLELPVVQREPRAAALLAGHDELLEHVRRLLAADQRAEAFLERPAEEFLSRALEAEDVDDSEAEEPSSAWIGRRVGAWKIVRELGRGGMGLVVLAERADGEFQQQVAIKLLKRGMDSEEILRRFHLERRVLALLQHPNIAHLIDGGLTDDGTPWFAMEYVEGDPLLACCDEQRMGIDARLDLFAQVCEGVRHAHRRLVIHRDLKPSNILLDAEGQVKLLDFGIAKLLEENPEDDNVTRPGQRLFTPLYAAPEQLRGEPTTTATDVYALGCVLYELLAGHPPLDARQRWVDRLQAAAELASSPPPPPSHRTRPAQGSPSDAGAASVMKAARLRGLHPRALTKRLAGDLDRIVLKAMQPDPAQRYSTVDALLEDLRRHRSALPILARPPSRRYRLSRFLRRHRIGMGAGAAIFVVLLAGVVVTSWQARIARRQAERAEWVKDYVVGLFQLSDPQFAQGEKLGAAGLLKRATERVDAELAGDVDLRAELQTVLGSVYSNLGDYESAKRLLARAVADLRSSHPLESRLRRRSENQLAFAHYMLSELEEAERIARPLVALGRSTPPGQLDAEYASSLNNMAIIDLAQGRLDESLSHHQQALDLDEQLFGQDSVPVSHDLSNLAVTLEALSREHEAEQANRRALEIRRTQLGNRHPDTATSMHNLGSSLWNLGRLDESEVVLREAVAARRALYEDAHPFLAESCRVLSGVLGDKGQDEESIALAEEALRMQREILGEDHPEVANAINSLALRAYRQGDYEQAIQRMRQAVDIWKRSLGPEHPDYLSALHNLGSVMRKQGDLAGAEAIYGEVLEKRRAILGEEHRDVAFGYCSLALLKRLQGELGDAQSSVDKSLEIYLALFGLDHHETLRTLHWKGVIQLDRGDAEGARRDLERASVGLRAKLGEEHAWFAESLAALGLATLESQGADLARPILEESAERLRASARDTGEWGAKVEAALAVR